MPGFSGSLSAAQINAVASYVASLGGGATTTTAAGGATTLPGSGAALYASNCSSCHGAAGGNLVGRGLSSAEIGAFTTSGGAGMPGFGSTLSAAEIDAITAYLVSLEPGASTTTPAGGGSGADLYAANCAPCHGPAGEGGVGGAIRGSDLDAAGLLSVIRDGFGTMPAFGDRLSEEDIAALAEYTETVAAGGVTTTIAGNDGSGGPVAHGGTDDGTSPQPWWKITLAVFLALVVAAGFGLLLVRSAREVFRS